jgi:hypothetical protein
VRGAIERCQQSGASRPTRRCADATDPIEPALRLLADVDAPVLFRGILFRDCRIGANDGARAVSGDGEVANDAAVAGDEVDGAVPVLTVLVLAWSGRRQVRWVASAASYGVINKVPSRVVLEFGVARSPAFREYPIRPRGQ